MTTETDDEVRAIVVVQLDAARRRGELLTSELISQKIETTAAFVESMHPDNTVNRAGLLRELESSYNVHVASWNALGDDDDHVSWLAEHRDKIEWSFWNRYKRYLRDVKRLPAASQERLDEVTDDILGRLENPKRPGKWDRRGLVAGQVQSGKTANYTGLICKAIDSGYKLVVVLAGIHNSLRSQTQARIDEGVLGFDTRKGLRFDKVDLRIGVGQLAGPFLHVNSFTSSEQNGDFNLRVASNIGVAVGGHDPVVLVVKKNKSILTNLHEWATKLRKEVDPETGRAIIRDVPVLLIDDEADNASVDTKGPKRGAESDEHDPSVINKLIRKFLYTFEQSAYVGYTATPFANIFINPEADHEEAGQDIFPRSFIVNLPAPSTYIGPARVFGLQEDTAENIDAVEPLPIVRHVDDFHAWIPDKHKADHVPGKALPSSLREAMRVFLLAGAVRAARGQGRQHHTMLVHVTMYTGVQRLISDQIREELDGIRRLLVYGEGAVQHGLWAELQKLYQNEFVDKVPLLAAFDDLRDQFGEFPPFDELRKHLQNLATATTVRTINGTSADAFEYIDHPEGISVIAVGGNKLSRGLTLEGLTVSYYLRASKMYDTLMQMGRWFGYRPGYLDVCRLYTTQELVEWYAAVTSATEKLVQEFEYMAAIGKTPKDFGLRVHQHPDGLLVTSPSKLRHARRLDISFAGAITESIIFKTDSASRSKNWKALTSLAQAIEASPAIGLSGRNDRMMWKHVPAPLVMDFFAAYDAHPDSLKAQPKAIIDYISARSHDNPAELTDWWVLIASNANPAPPYTLLGHRGRLIKRAQYPKRDVNKKFLSGRYSIRRIVSPADEMVDFSSDSQEWRDALQQTREAWAKSTRKDKAENQPNSPSGLSIRLRRPAERGLLILYPLNPSAAEAGLKDKDVPFLGFAVSFPHSDRAEPVSYQVNPVFWQLEYGRFDDDVDDEEY